MPALLPDLASGIYIQNHLARGWLKILDAIALRLTCDITIPLSLALFDSADVILKVYTQTLLHTHHTMQMDDGRALASQKSKKHCCEILWGESAETDCF